MAEQSTPPKVPYICVGDSVHWHVHGDINREPIAAVVTRINDKNQSMVQISLIREGAVTFEPSEGWVYHVNDQVLVDNPNRAINSGAWSAKPAK